MAQTIKLKRSSVSGNTPSTSDLELGEVAINTYDGKMFIKKNDGSDSIVEIGGSSGTVTDAFKTIAVSGQTSVVADSATDTLTLVAGTNMSITTNATGDSITFASTGSSGSATFLGLSDTPANFTGAAGKYLKVNSSGNSIEFDSLTFSDLASTPTTIAGYGITDALQLGTSATTALAGNTSIPSVLTDLSISDGSNGQVLQTDGSGNFSFVNQTGGNSFGTIAVSGQSNVVADQGSDTLTLVAGSNVTLTTNASGDSVTIASTGGSGTTAADAIFEEYQFTATSGQTTFTGSDDNSETLSYTANAIQVYLNGIFLDPSVDYTATNGTSIVLAETVDANDYLQVVAYKKKISDGQTTVDTFSGNGSTTAFTLSLDPGDENNTRVFIDGVYQSKSNYSVSGTTLTFATAPPNATAVEVEIGNRVVTLDTTSSIDLPDNVRLRAGTGNDLQIYHNSNVSYIQDSAADLRIESNNITIRSVTQENFITTALNGAVSLYYDNNKKFETTNAGITVTGAMTSTGNIETPTTLNFTGAGGYVSTTGAYALRLRTNNTEALRLTSGQDAVFAGTVTANAGITVDNYTLDNNRISTNQSGGYSGDILLDAAGDMIFDADGGDFRFKDNGTQQFIIDLDDSVGDVMLRTNAVDKDMIFQGNDGGSNITALRLDMSDGGAAFFSDDIRINDSKSIRFGDDQDFRITNDGSTTILQNVTADQDILIKGNDGGSTITALTLDMSNSGKATFTGIVTSAIGFERGNLFITENEIDVSSGNLTLDVAGNINLDADNSGNVYLRDDGVAYGRFHKTNNNWVLKNVINEGDILFQGKDSGGSELTALTLDMSDAGAAIFNGHGTFNDTVTINSTSAGAVTVSGSGGGINLTGGNNRIYFGGQRAMEGITSNGNIQIGEGFSGLLILQMNTEVQGNLSLADNKILRLGSDTDLQIYHSSTESWIKDTGSGSLYIDTDGPSIQLTSGNSAKNMVQAVKDGAVNLFYNNSQKLATSSSGVSVTGQLTATSDFIAADSGGTARGYLFGTSAGLFLRYNSGSNLQIQEAGSTRVTVSGSSVGIGTTSPAARLHVVGPAARPTDLASVDTASTAQFQADSSNAHSLYIAENASGALIQVNDGATNSTNAKPLALQPFGGNVGIGQGVTAPTYTLDVQGTARVTHNNSGALFQEYNNGMSLWLDGSNGDFSGGDYFGVHAYSTTSLDFSYAAVSQARVLSGGGFEVLNGGMLRAYRSGNSAYGALFMDTAENLYIRNSWANKDIVLKRDGNVGIGTSSPTAILETVSATSGGAPVFRAGTADFLGVQVGTQGVGFSIETNNYFSLWHQPYADRGTQTNLTERVRMLSSGRIGIGHTAPNANLHINAGNNSAVTIGDATNPALQIGGTTNYRFGVYTDGETAYIENKNGDNGIVFRVKTKGEVMRVEGVSGDWMVGNTVSRVASFYNNQAGCGWRESDHHFEIATTDNRSALEVGRNNGNSGDVITIRQQGTSVGMIGTEGGDSLVIQSNGSTGIGLRFHPSTTNIDPVRQGARIDNVVSLGSTTHRFKNIHITGGVEGRVFGRSATQTSLANINFWDATNGIYPGHTHIVSNSTGSDGTHASGQIKFWNYDGSSFLQTMTIDKSGTLMVGQNTGTVYNQTSVSGVTASGSGYFQMAAPDATVMYVNRIGSSSEGQVIGIYEAGAAVGGVSSYGDTIQFGQGNVYLKMSNAVDAITPANGSGTNANGTLDLGSSSARFKDLHMSGELVRQYRTFYSGSSTSAQYIKLYDQNTHGRIPGKTLHFRAYAYNHSEHSIEVRVDIPTYGGFYSSYGTMNAGQGSTVEIIAGGLSTQTNIFKEILVIADLSSTAAADGTEIWLKIQPPHSTTAIALKEFAESVPITAGTSDWTTTAPSNIQQTYPINVGHRSINGSNFGMDKKIRAGTTRSADLAIATPDIITEESFGVNDGSNKAIFSVDRINFNKGNYYVLNENASGVRLINGNTSWTTQSDEKLKENITELPEVLTKVQDLRCVSYNLKDQSSENVRLGFIAQDWQKDFSEVVDLDESDNTLGMNYTETIPVLLKAIQEQTQIINDLRARVAQLEKE